MKFRGLSSNSLKVIAILAMTVDHVAWLFVPTATLLGQLLHLVGRITAPVMAFFIAEGYYKTKNLGKYFLRLGLFAVLSHLPYTFFLTGTFALWRSTSIFATLFLGLAALTIAKSSVLQWYLQIPLIALTLYLSTFCDWGVFIVVWVLLFGLVRERSTAILLFGGISIALLALEMIQYDTRTLLNSLYALGILLSIPLLSLYNNERGHFNLKYLFYIYYPVHLVVLQCLAIYSAK